MTVSEVGPDAGKLALYAAIQEGFMKKDGISITLSDSHGSSQGAQAVVAHAVDIAEVGDTDAISARAAGGNIALICGEENVAPYTVNVAPSITAISQLRGKKTSPGSGPTNIATLYFNAALTANGVQPSQTTPIYEGTTGDRFASLESGAVSASLLLPPFNFEAEAKGYKTLATISQYSNLPFTAFATSPAWAKKNKTTVTNFIKAYLQGASWVYSPANKAGTISILEKYTHATPAAAQQTYQFFINTIHTIPTNGSLGNVSGVISALKSVGGLSKPVTTSQVEDLSFLNAATAGAGS